jgi:hypothetical protein
MKLDWNAVGSVSTTIAVLLGAWQVRRGRLQATTDFEDDLSREYRELSRAIPMSIHLGELFEGTDYQRMVPYLYQYLDLSNEQIFLRMNGRISKATWEQWVEGIESTISLPVFARAWLDVKTKAPQRFSELRRLESTKYQEDPRSWMGLLERVRRSWAT